MGRKFDIAIIGSGLGGLVTANILSKKGYHVCVLEQNSHPGGCLQSFEKDGCIYDTGIHYVGGLSEGQVLHRIFTYLNLFPDLNIRKMDPEGFDRFVFGDAEYTYPTGYDAFRERMVQYFPTEASGIDTYISKIRGISESISLYNLEPVMYTPENLYGKFSHGNAWEFIRSVTPDAKLQHLLSGLNMLYAGTTESSFLYMHALINNHYLQGPWRFVDGSRQVSDLLIRNMKSHGGELFTRKKIIALKGHDQAITRAISEDGDEFLADHFIGAIHPQLLMALLEPDMGRKSFRNRIAGLDNTVSCFTLYVAFKQGEVPYMNRNLYYYPGGNAWGLDYYKPDEFPQYLGFYPIADTVDEKFTRSGSVISFMNYSEVEKWENSSIEDRGEAYNQFKEEKALRMIEALDQAFPGIRKSIRAYSTATPLTLRDYTGTVAGSIYGIQRDFRNPNQSILLPQTKLKNLFLTGQNLSLHGMLGTTMGALLTSGQFCDLNGLLNEIRHVY